VQNQRLIKAGLKITRPRLFEEMSMRVFLGKKPPVLRKITSNSKD